MTTLITGASAGIGVEFATVCAAARHDLILVARDEQRLKELARVLETAHGITVTVMPADLSLPAAPETLVGRCNDAGLNVDVLINNAGFGTNGRFAELDAARELRQLQVNVCAVTHLTRLLLPAMIARKSGRILNVASTAGFQPGPFMAVYYASKAYVISFTEALAEELRGTGVTATVLCPGPTRTEFQARAGLKDAAISSDVFLMDAASVARAGVEGMMKGRVIVVPGLSNRIGRQLARLFPRMLTRKLVAGLNRQRMPD